MRHALKVAVGPLITTFAFATSALGAQTGARAMFIVDASASMSQPLGSMTKLEAVRDAVSTVETMWDPTIEVGLMVFGHRRRVDCTDIETLISPVSLVTGAAPLSQALKGINPQGLTPISEAVMQAAVTLGYTNRPAAIVLICDGIDTCGGNPREAVLELLRKAADLRIHLVAVEMRADEIEVLKPLATETRGRIYPVTTRDELIEALCEIAIEPFGFAQNQAAVDQPKSAPATPSSGSGAAGVLELNTMSAIDGWPLTAVYFIRRKNDFADELSVKPGAGPRFYLEPGKYTVEAKWGPAKAQSEIEVASGETVKHTFVLAAGTLKLTAKLSEDSSTVRAVFHIYQTPEREGDRMNLLTTSRTGNVQLPAGEYLIEAEWGGVPAELERVEVFADEIVEKTIFIPAGVLKIEARMAPDGEIIRPSYSIVPQKREGESPSQSVASGAMSPAGFRLPAGQYTVTAEWGNVTATMDVEVRAGQITEKKLNMNAGIIQLKTTSALNRGQRVTFSIEEQDATGSDTQRRVVARGSQREFRLPAGKYVVVASSGSVEGEHFIEVQAGKRHDVTIALE